MRFEVPTANWLMRRAGRRVATALLVGAGPLGASDRIHRRLVREAARRSADGDPARAVPIVASLARRPPRDPALLAGLGRAAESVGYLPVAVGDLAAAVRRAPDPTWRRALSRLYERLGRGAEAAGDPRGAVTAYRQAVAHDPARGATYHRLGRALERAGHLLEAALAYERAVHLDGSRQAWRRRLARARRAAPHWVHFSTTPGAGQPPAAIAAVTGGGVVAPVTGPSIVGWLAAPAAAEPVVIRLNGEPVAEARATREVTLPDGRTCREFRRRLRDVWAYAGAGDVLTVEHAGRPLPIIDNGRRHVFPAGRSRAGVLLDGLRQGQVLNKYGALQRPLRDDPAWQARMYALFRGVRTELRDRFGLTLFPFYGTLLGAVRERDFIGHDNDFDTLYISGHATAAAIRAEFTAVCRHLIDRGYSLTVRPTHTRVWLPDDDRKLDIFYGWFNPDGVFQVSFGYHGPPVERSADFATFQTATLGSLRVPVPVNAEALLAQCYGEGWRVPDPGFRKTSPTRVLPAGYSLDPGEVNDPYWHQFYRDHQIRAASGFAGAVAARLAPGSVVLDVGCGTGRDTIHLAGQGHAVTGVDRSPAALRRAAEAHQRAPAGRAAFARLDVADPTALVDLLTRTFPRDLDPDRTVVYARFFLHSVPAAVEQALLAALTRTLTGGFRWYAEFRTVEDRDRPKTYGEHYRRFLDHERFLDRLRRRWGFIVEQVETGTGLSPHRDEDPYLARVFARYPGERSSS